MERIDRRAPNLATLMAAPRGLSANEIKGACVFPSRPRPARRSTGRIQISDFRQHPSLAKSSRFSNRGSAVKT